MKHLKLIFACLLMAVLSIGQVWANDPTITWDFVTLQATSGTQDGITWASGKTGSASNTAANTTHGLVLYGVSSGGGYFYTTSAINGSITKIEVLTSKKTNTPKYTVYGSTNGSDWTQIGNQTTGGSTAEFSTDAGYTYLKIANTTAATAQLGLKNLVITYSPSGSEEPTLFLNPSLSRHNSL